MCKVYSLRFQSFVWRKIICIHYLALYYVFVKAANEAVVTVCLSVSSTSSSSSVLVLDEWGGCGFPPARPSWLTDLWMTLSPPLSLRSHIPQQCHICPAAQSATIWNGFVLTTPKWLQIILHAVLCHSGCCRLWIAWQMPLHWHYCLRCSSFYIAASFVRLDPVCKVWLPVLFLSSPM